MAPSPSPAPSCPAGGAAPHLGLHKDQVVAVWGLCTGKGKDSSAPNMPTAGREPLMEAQVWSVGCLCPFLGPSWFKCKQQRPGTVSTSSFFFFF